MAQYFLTEEQEMVRDLARQIAQEKVIPVRAELDEQEKFPWEIMKILAEADLFRVWIPEEYGGLGGGILGLCLAMEELSRACAGVAVSYAGSALGGTPILLYGSEDQKQKYLPQLASGERLGAFALTEANAGSDAAGMQVTARKVDGGYLINGTKQWITNGGEAEINTVIAMTDRSRGARGATAFIVEKGAEGFSFGKKEKKMGIRASSTRELVFQDCFVPEDQRLGREGMGFIVGMKTFDQSRPGIGAQAVGIAQGAFDEAMRFARERHQFGKPISSFQAVQHMLANMATEIEASRVLVYHAARLVDAGDRSATKIAAMAKVFPSDMAMRVTTDAVQIMGGSGYMREYPVEKMMRDAKITQIYEGTNQIMRNVIAANLIKESAAS
ncbi:MAG: acyl-CoA dehydrogenase family protein [Candidatus Latescibacterota bacterium]